MKNTGNLLKDSNLCQEAKDSQKKTAVKISSPRSEVDIQKLIQELEVHQIELEQQNEELAMAKEQAEFAAKKYTELYDFAPSGYFIFSSEGGIIDLNLSAAKMLGEDRSSLKTGRFGFFVSDDKRADFAYFLRKVFSSHTRETCELTLITNDNITIHVHLSGIVDENGEQCLVTAIDITDRRLAEESLQISLRKYQFLFDSFPLGITISDQDGNIIESNQKAAILLGLKEEEQLKRQIDGSNWSIVQSDGSPFPTEKYPGVIALKENRNVENIEMGIVKGKNNITWLNITAAPVPIENYGVAIAYSDITDRKKVEKALVISEERFHSLFDNMAEGVALQELVFEDGKPIDYRIVDVNNSFVKILSLSRKKVVGKLSIKAYDASTPPFFEKCLEVVNSKIPIYFESYFAPLDKHFGISVAPWHENGFATIFLDISDRKKAEAEINLKNEKLQKINSEKDKFFSIIAHDLRSPFTSIIGFSELLVEQVNEKYDDGIRKYADIILQSSQKAMDLLMNLMEWSRSQTGRIEFNPEYIEMVKHINDISQLYSIIANQKSITLTKVLPTNAPVHADKAMLNTIFRNLISNAIKFTNRGGEIILSVEAKQNELTISIADSGIGISEDRIEKLFQIDESFSTPGTQNEKGTGLGLILCKEFVEKHGGKIWAESKEGNGSTFQFTLPIKDALM